MKKLLVVGIAAAVLCGSPALAADMPIKAPVHKMPAPLFSWAGFYVGGTAGYAWGSYTEFAVVGGDGPNVDTKGFVGGVSWGTNWQVDNWVFGFESDVSNGPRGSNPLGTIGPNFSCNTGKCVVDINYFSTSRVRLGVTSNQWLLYTTGGLASGRIVGGVENSTYWGGSTRYGWTAGGGIEYAFDQRWSTKIEYLHVDLGNAHFGYARTDPIRARGDFDVVRFGLNYRFGDIWSKILFAAKD